ncbi:MAG: DUF1573 domain-containing protein [Crocinitomicaceae bacterium]|nr:DUF1573 domain-containing protein [Crocinitomicaceae bacterium]
MKKLILSLAVSVGFLTAAYAQSQVVTGPAITVDKEVHDYGTIPFGGNGTCEFKVTNSGTEPLILQKCKGSCGCTVPTCEPNPIMPGESSVITVKYDTKRAGAINKSVTITSNATNEPSKVVRIKGTVAPDPNAPAPGSAPVKEPTGPANN